MDSPRPPAVRVPIRPAGISRPSPTVSCRSRRARMPTAAADVLDAFADDGVLDASFALPDFGPGAAFPGSQAIGFHFVDYVVHGWDVARAIESPFTLPADVIAAVAAAGLRHPRRRLPQRAGIPVRTGDRGQRGGQRPRPHPAPPRPVARLDAEELILNRLAAPATRARRRACRPAADARSAPPAPHRGSRGRPAPQRPPSEGFADVGFADLRTEPKTSVGQHEHMHQPAWPDTRRGGCGHTAHGRRRRRRGTVRCRRSSGSPEPTEGHRVGDAEARVDALGRGVVAGLCDRVRREIDAEHVVAQAGQQDRVFPGSAAGVEHLAADQAAAFQLDDRRLRLADDPRRGAGS